MFLRDPGKQVSLSRSRLSLRKQETWGLAKIGLDGNPVRNFSKTGVEI